jgi:hypothetical protein
VKHNETFSTAATNAETFSVINELFQCLKGMTTTVGGGVTEVSKGGIQAYLRLQHQALSYSLSLIRAEEL